MSLSVLVTGATGFIGNHLINSLQNSSYDLHATVRNIPSHSQGDIQYSLIKDLNPQTDWSAALEGIDIVIHLAGRAHILKDQVSNPLQEFQTINTEATASLVKQAIVFGVKHFIFISSIGAMATLAPQIVNEEDPCNPNTPYGLSKLQAEEKLTQLAQNSLMKWTILRPTLVYGPKNPGNMDRLINLINRGVPLPLGSIQNKRSFLYVGNLVDAIIQCINNPKAFNQLFIISDSQDLSTPELITQISQALNKKSRLLPLPEKSLKFIGQITSKTNTIDRLTGSLVVDSSKIRQTLNWTPPYTFQEGIQKTCNWYLQSCKNDN